MMGFASLETKKLLVLSYINKMALYLEAIFCLPGRTSIVTVATGDLGQEACLALPKVGSRHYRIESGNRP